MWITNLIYSDIYIYIFIYMYIYIYIYIYIYTRAKYEFVVKFLWLEKRYILFFLFCLYTLSMPFISYSIWQDNFLHENMKKHFPSKSIKTLYRRKKNLKEILSPLLFLAKPKNIESCITSCKKSDICKSYLITDNRLSVKLLVGFLMSVAICLVTAVMLST